MNHPPLPALVNPTRRRRLDLSGPFGEELSRVIGGGLVPGSVTLARTPKGEDSRLTSSLLAVAALGPVALRGG